MEELNRPLGLKPERQKRRRPAFVTILALAGMALGLSAIGFIVWDRLSPPGQQTVKIEQADISPPQPPAVETQSPAQTGDDTGGTDFEPIDDGEAGLQDLQPDGAIAVPKPRPPRAAPQETAFAHLPDPELIERGPSGPLPVRSPDGRRPMDVYARQPDTTGNFGVARVVIIVGGMGISQTSTMQAIEKLPAGVTLAFAPYGNSLARWMQAARKAGHELLVQIPMEPFGYPQSTPGPNTLTVDEARAGALGNLHWSMAKITNYVGVMNYQGGKLLSDAPALGAAFDDIAGRGLLFVDEGSASGSKARAVARASLLPFAAAHVQIDAKRTRRDIAASLQELEQLAKRSGMAIGVANAFGDSIDMIAQYAKDAGARGIEITPVSAIVTDPERNR